MKRKGFTLIELLAVIVVLAIIALIAIPIVINIIEGVKLSSVKRSSEGYIHALDITLSQVRLDNNNPTTCEVVDDKLSCNEKEYTVETSGDTFLLTELVVSEEGYISAVIKKDNYCIMKRGNETEYTYKKIVDKVNNAETEITENNCSLDPHTSEKCFAFDSSSGTITDYYNYEDNASSGVACPRDVIIPKKIGGVEVTTLGYRAFYLDNLTSIVIPNGIKSIGKQAFYFNSLTELIIPEGVTQIADYAFGNNKLENVSLPKSLTSLSSHSFSNNKLPQETAYFYKRNTDGSIDYSTIIGYGGTNAEGGKDIEIPSEKNGVKLTTIGKQAFMSNQLTSVVIPNGVTTIGTQAFYQNHLTNVVIPEGVTQIADYAFNSNPLTSVKVKNSKENVTLDTSAFGTFDTENIEWNYVEETTE